MADDVSPSVPATSVVGDEKLNKIIFDLTEYIDNSHCGYCKAILGDAKSIIVDYGQIQDRAVLMDKLQHERGAMLEQTKQQANMMIRELLPGSGDQQGLPMFTRRQNGPASRVKNNRFMKWAFGDFFEGLF